MRVRQVVTAALPCVAGVAAAAGAQEVRVAVGHDREPQFLMKVARRAPAPVAAGAVPARRRRVSVDGAGATLEQALTEVAAQAGLRLTYSKDVVGLDRPVQLKAERITVAAALTELLLDAGVNLVVTPAGHLAVVRKAADREAADREAAQQAGVVAGTVTDSASGRPLAGVQVTLGAAGAPRGAVTGDDGRYRIANVPAGRYAVTARRIGYTPATRTGAVADGPTVTADFVVSSQAAVLSAVVAVGYGTQRREDVTGAVTSVNVEQTRSAPIVSVDQVLQGRAAGVQVTQSNGAPGGGVTVRVRGTNSISATSEPLYVIDGVPAFVGSRSANPTANPLADINPSDVESIEVLKDASSAAIYGARGANGVVIVTTRRGRRGESTSQLESSYGAQRITRTLDLLDAREYAELINEAQANINRPALYTPEQVAAFGQGTDWQDEVFRPAAVQNHSLNFSGGDERTRYLVSGNLFDQGGILENTGFRRYSGRINLDREVGPRFRIGNSLTLSRTTADLGLTDNGSGPQAGAVQGALEFLPTLPVRDSLGNYVQIATVTPTPNPVATALDLTNRRASSRVVGNVFGEYGLTDALRLRVSLGGNANFERTTRYAPRTIQQGVGTRGNAQVQSFQGTELLNENIVTYRRALTAASRVDLTGGFTVQTSRRDSLFAGAQDFATDLTGVDNIGAGAVAQTPGSNADEWALLSYLGRVNYQLRDRYLFTVTGRYDGSSRFGANNKWGFFPSAAVAWRLSQEPFMRALAAVSDAKLRLSYGSTGNQEIDRFASLARLATGPVIFGTQQAIGFFPAGRAPNPDLKWESTRQVNAGLDLGLFKDRLTFTFDAYRSRTNDLLLEVQLPVNTGFTSQLRNVGSVRNRGVEVGVSTVNVSRDRFTWRSSLNLARNRNEAVALGPASRIFAGGQKIGGDWDGNVATVLQVGQPLGAFFGFRTSGVWQQGETGPEAVPGEWRFVDVNGDGRITLEDRTVIGDPNPAVFGGLSNSLSLGRLSLDVFVQGSYGNDVLNAGVVRLTTVSGGTNELGFARGRWRPDRPSNVVPRANAARPRRLHDMHVEDGSFLRLQTVTLGYQLPDGLLPGARRARVYVNGQNLAVWTNYSGYDPEVSSYGGDPAARGIDLGVYPRARTVTAGVNLTF